MTLQLRAYAKINLYLDVTGRRTDGYHDILSIMQTVSLHDTVTVTVLEDQDSTAITLECDRAELPCDDKNLAYRAAKAFYDAVGYQRRTHIAIEKRIPVSAGLAGGSTDAAAVLKGLNRLCGMPFSVSALCAIGKRLGADIPFCITGGTAEVRGIGEQLSPCSDMPPLAMVVAKKGEGVSTPAAYGALDRMFDGFSGRYAGGTAPAGCYGALLDAIGRKDSVCIAEHLYNVFEKAVLPIHSEASGLKTFLEEQGAIAALMSGSGPSVLGIFRDLEAAERATKLLNEGEKVPVAFAVTPVIAEGF